MFTTTVKNLVTHLSDDLGLKKDDMVFMHSGLIELGNLENGLDTITEAFSQVLSEGLLVIPSFTYSWCNGKSFDLSTTECPNEIGSYSKDAWKTSQFMRSGNPNFSVAALKNKSNGKLIETIFDNGRSCFGEKSVFDHMYALSEERDGYILLLGGAHNDFLFRCAFIHYVEEKACVPSRYLKRFYDPNNKNEYVEQLCRFLTQDEYDSVAAGKETHYQFPVISDYTALGEDLKKCDFFVHKPFGYGASRMVNLRKFCDFLSEKLNKYPDYNVGVN